MNSPRVAVHCSSCGALAEAPTFGSHFVVGTLPEALLQAHSACDLWVLHARLSAAARDLSPEYSR